MYAMIDKSTTMESDSFFKSLTPDDYIDTDGNVEAPTGWFGLLCIDDAFRDAYGKDTGNFVPASVHDGVYIVSIDNNGLVWAEQAPTVEATVANYNQMQHQYAEWYNDENGED